MTRTPPRTRTRRLDANRRRLAAMYAPFARSMAARMARAWPEAAEDLAGAALLGLCQAARAFEPARQVRFSTWAGIRVRGAMVDEARGLARGRAATARELAEERNARAEQARRASEDTAEATAARRAAWALDPADPRPGPRAAIEAADAFEARIRPLPARSRELLRLVYRDGLDQQDAAAILGLSKSRASVLHAAALDALRPAAEAEGLAPRPRRRP